MIIKRLQENTFTILSIWQKKNLWVRVQRTIFKWNVIIIFYYFLPKFMYNHRYAKGCLMLWLVLRWSTYDPFQCKVLFSSTWYFVITKMLRRRKKYSKFIIYGYHQNKFSLETRLETLAVHLWRVMYTVFVIHLLKITIYATQFSQWFMFVFSEISEILSAKWWQLLVKISCKLNHLIKIDNALCRCVGSNSLLVSHS